jgi:hypothetical protein
VKPLLNGGIVRHTSQMLATITIRSRNASIPGNRFKYFSLKYVTFKLPPLLAAKTEPNITSQIRTSKQNSSAQAMETVNRFRSIIWAKITAKMMKQHIAMMRLNNF